MSQIDQNPAAYYASLPKKRVAAACIIRSEDGAVVLLKPTYKPGWELPGGGVELDESPYDACFREVQEELGLERRPKRLLGVNYQRAAAGRQNESLTLVFDGGVLTLAEARTIRLAPEEIAEWQFVPPDRLPEFLGQSALKCVTAFLNSHAPAFLVDGEAEEGWQAGQ